MQIWLRWRTLAAVAVACFVSESRGNDGVDFAREIRPIFQARCVRCHGPERQRSGFRIDRRADAFKGGDEYGPAIVPGKSAESPVFKMIASRKMPREGPALAEAEIERIRKWIDSGAVWPQDNAAANSGGEKSNVHWSFKPMMRPPLPVVNDAKWPRNPIDRFILASLEKVGLTPSPEADRATLIRRVSFDLIGLPPSPEEVEQFVRDPDPSAYERLVDRLLASPHHGERWARHWLDVVRFAESHGFEMNQPRPNAWRYRDYVIRSFNEDKPYDQFIREQLAGDVLGADEATGFLVAGPWDQVKSPDPVLTAQQRADELHDMIGATGSAFLGLTVACARCHSHKFDPIPQADYYRMKACFEGVQHGERAIGGAASIDLAKKRAGIERLRARLDAFAPKARLGRRVVMPPNNTAGTARLAAAQGPHPYASGSKRGESLDPGSPGRLPNLSSGFLAWTTTSNDLLAWRPNVNGRFRVWVSWGCNSTHSADAQFLFDRDGKVETRDDQSKIATVDQRRFADGSEANSTQTRWSGFRDVGVHPFRPESCLILRGGSAGITTADVVVLEEVNDGQLPQNQPALRLPVDAVRNVDRFEPVSAKFVRFMIQSTTDVEPCLDELEIFTSGPKPRNVAPSAKATASSSLPGNPIHKLAHINDGRYGNDWSWISNEKGKGWVALEFNEPAMIDRVVWSRDRGMPTKFRDRLATRYRIETSLDGQHWELAATSDDRLPYRSLAFAVPGGFLPDVAEDSPALDELLAELRRQEEQFPKESAQSNAYAGQFVQPGLTLRLHRGDATQPKEPINAGSLTQFGATFELPADAPERDRRLALARWIADARNPLTARVMANRVWHYHFGSGIVSTPSDFGVNGGRPSHPEMLDWIAIEFAVPADASKKAWSLKQLHRLICLSATYRQASRPVAKAAAIDADARLLWRYPPRRLDAEPLRDAILAVTGKLNLKAGGPGFDLFEPNTNYVKVYTPRKTFGPEEFRRMVYQSKPRMQLDDTFGAFDCPDGGQVAPRRGSSTTPLQAFNLLNSPFMLQQAEFFAARLRSDAGERVGDQVQRGFQLAFGRATAADEAAAAETLIREHGLPAFCRALLCANEFLYVP
jgi:hypothetical protein